MPPIKITNKPLAAALVFAAVPLAMLFFAAMPLAANVESIGVDISRRQAFIDGYDQRIAKARDFILFSKRERAGFDSLDDIFIDSQMPLDFIGFLEAAAGKTGVKMEFSPSMPQRAVKGEWPSLTMEASLSGRILDIWQFVEMVENAPYLAAAQNFEVEAVRASSLSDEFIPEKNQTYGKARILLKVYVRSQSK